VLPVPAFEEPEPLTSEGIVWKPPEPTPVAATLPELAPRSFGADVWLYPGVLAPNFCRHLIDRFEDEPRRQIAPKGGYEHRRCPMFHITASHGWEAEDKELAKLLGHVGKHYFSMYHGFYQWLSTVEDSGYEMGCYRPPRDHCEPHHDGPAAGPNKTRLASLVIYLNTVTEGAETMFPKQEIVVHPEEGAILIFPPHFTHPHFVPPPVKMNRYFIVTWFISTLWAL